MLYDTIRTLKTQISRRELFTLAHGVTGFHRIQASPGFEAAAHWCAAWRRMSWPEELELAETLCFYYADGRRSEGELLDRVSRETGTDCGWLADFTGLLLRCGLLETV